MLSSILAQTVGILEKKRADGVSGLSHFLEMPGL